MIASNTASRKTRRTKPPSPLRQARAAVLLRIVGKRPQQRLRLDVDGYRLLAVCGLRRGQVDVAISDLLADGRIRLFAGNCGLVVQAKEGADR
jgi:hypothetical protein